MWYAKREAAGIGGGIQPANSKMFWDHLVNIDDHIGNNSNQPLLDDEGELTGKTEGPATQAQELRRLSPVHNNPENTTLESSLEALRHQNVNSPFGPDSGALAPNTISPTLYRGVPQRQEGNYGYQGEHPAARSRA